MNSKILKKAKVKKNTKKPAKRNTRTRFRRRRFNIRPRIPRNIMPSRRIAAASAKNMNRRFTIIRQDGNSVRVSGRDLIYSIPDSLTSPVQTTNVIAVIPANPVYWIGTRIAALACGYQNYRPMSFKISYIPMCAVTQQGNVIGGTIWDDGIASDNIQQSLRTSNGGFLTQCYVPHTTVIKPKSNLQYNLYRIGGNFDVKSNPFLFVAMAIGCTNASSQKIVPGYFYVTWTYELKNPIGKVSAFYNSGLTTFSTYSPQMNNTLINLTTNSEVPFGAYIDVEYESNSNVTYYNRTPITVESTSPVWIFQSVQKSSETTIVNKLPIYYTSLQTTNVEFTAIKPDSGLKFTSFDPIAYVIDNPQNDYYEVYELEDLTANTTITENKTIVLANEINLYIITTQQVFGIYDSRKLVPMTYKDGGLTANVYCSYYKASKAQFKLALQTNKNIKLKLPEKIHFATTMMEKLAIVDESDSDNEDIDQEPEFETLIQPTNKTVNKKSKSKSKTKNNNTENTKNQ